MIVTCMQCGKEFNKPDSEIRKGPKNFCSAKCWGESKNTRIEKVCPGCGKTFIAPPPKPRNPYKFCSRKCYTNWNKGANNPKFKDYKCHAKNGYVYLNHPDAKNRMEHRAVYEAYLGRPLKRHEHVHHINGDKHDNRIENLELWDTLHPCGQRVEDKIAWAKEYLASHGYAVIKGVYMDVELTHLEHVILGTVGVA